MYAAPDAIITQYLCQFQRRIQPQKTITVNSSFEYFIAPYKLDSCFVFKNIAIFARSNVKLKISLSDEYVMHQIRQLLCSTALCALRSVIMQEKKNA